MPTLREPLFSMYVLDLWSPACCRLKSLWAIFRQTLPSEDNKNGHSLPTELKAVARSLFRPAAFIFLFSSDSDGFKAPGKVPLRSALPTHVFPVKTSSVFE